MANPILANEADSPESADVDLSLKPHVATEEAPQVITSLFWAVVIAVALIALGSFSLSFTALYALATDQGIPSLLGWIWPLIVDLSMVIYTAAILVAQLQRRKARLPISLTIFYGLVTIIGNILHAPTTWLGWFVASLPPLSLILGTEMLRTMAHHMILQRGAVNTLTELKTQIGTCRTELDKLVGQIEDRQNRLTELKQVTNAEAMTETGAFVNGDSAALDKANAVKMSKVKERRSKVLTMWQKGMDKADIAQALEVSVRTVGRDISALNGQVGVAQ